MKTKQLILLTICTLLLCSCANREVVTECISNDTYGFFGGLWHGFIMIFDLIGMIFYDDVTIYATNNNSGWYAFGFFIGSNLTVGSIAKALDR